MTPKEKAKKLVEIESEYTVNLSKAKEYALNVVYEILSLGKKLPLELLEYYLEVKKEIEKL